LLGYPAAADRETWHGLSVWEVYAATSSISVTLALALLTFFFTHIEGIRMETGRCATSELIRRPEAPTSADRPLEILGQFMRSSH